ncbi:hypothetical protein PC129_g22827 [Phytophthora cactorum]|uniref:Uncharacterized protein n=1 Tax=Phytophthora cactorum TaxID=29920 RepID=A0A329RC21_9STRA|nr:hypothetical protein Pcac1_g17157 [Phytophthora cactorum]KAG2815260.1 hypothetical protein PC113_g23227 [Phytophthora cactorum]KAG2839316.1 hypothetical protein PC111_g3917 [Phytophthora cactorum]KAG2873256.1 hypothetical protein PC114_g25955 [Phytophthora cactorum]KAG2878470.1 hypothetical protein PC115_g23056 [Phytophthora cactorum]
MLAGFKAVFNKVDDMDLKAAEMINRKTPEKAEEVYLKLADDILPLLQGMEQKGITPESLKNHAKFKDLSNNEGEYLQHFYKTYWETFPRLKNVET